MKKILSAILALMLVFGCVLAVTSCKKEEETDTTEETEKNVVTLEGEYTFVNDSDVDCSLKFAENGELVYTAGDDVTTGKYSIVDDVITITLGDTTVMYDFIQADDSITINLVKLNKA